jgi:hypothetical protein
MAAKRWMGLIAMILLGPLTGCCSWCQRHCPPAPTCCVPCCPAPAAAAPVAATCPPGYCPAPQGYHANQWQRNPVAAPAGACVPCQ